MLRFPVDSRAVRAPVSWNLALFWILATSAGWAVAQGLTEVSGQPALGILIGPLVGTAQWMVLRGKVSGAAWWVGASTVGWIVGGVSAANMTASLDGFTATMLSGAWLGAVIGALQWFVLKDKVAWAEAWVAASTAGWLAVQVAIWVVEQVFTLQSDADLFMPAAGVLTGAVTSVALVWLLRRPADRTRSNAR